MLICMHIYIRKGLLNSRSVDCFPEVAQKVFKKQNFYNLFDA